MADPSQILALRPTIMDYQQLQAAFQQKQALDRAQMQKLSMPDVDQLGEQALFKAAQGFELTPPELAAAKYADAKSGGIQFNPVTGSLMQKPSIGAKLGLGLDGGTGAVPATMATPVPQVNPGNEFDIDFQRQYDAARGNPKLQQTLMETYSKEKFKMNDDQSKAAGFAGRMLADEPILNNPANIKASTSLMQRGLSQVPIIGNKLVSDEYQSATQGQRDFINALLRRESGAAINKDEFDNGRQQYFPQPGDSDTVIAQKAANRKTSLQGIQRSAGPAYKNPSVPTQTDALAELRRRGKI